MLEMKVACLVCESALQPMDNSMICSYECTYCPKCARELSFVCKNCSGELVARPKRVQN